MATSSNIHLTPDAFLARFGTGQTSIENAIYDAAHRLYFYARMWPDSVNPNMGALVRICRAYPSLLLEPVYHALAKQPNRKPATIEACPRCRQQAALSPPGSHNPDSFCCWYHPGQQDLAFITVLLDMCVQ